MGVVRELELPVGVVTMLFTDIEGSTRLLDDAGHPVEQLESQLQEQSRSRLRARLGGAAFDAQIDAGYAAATDTVIAAALQD